MGKMTTIKEGKEVESDSDFDEKSFIEILPQLGKSTKRKIKPRIDLPHTVDKKC